MTPKPDFERVKTALLGGQPDRVPLAELKMDTPVMEAFMGKPVKDLKDEVEFWASAGYDFIRFRPKFDFQHQAAKANVANYSLYGNHKEERKWAAEKEGVITNTDDFDNFPWPRPEDIDYSRLEEVKEYLPKGMKVITGVSGIWEAVWMLFGFESFSYALSENPELVEKMFNKTGEILYGIFERSSAFESVGAMWYTDDIAYTEGLMVSPSVYRRHLFPWMRKMADVCRKRKLPLLFHSDGRLWDVMDDLVEIGVQALHPIEPKGMDIIEVKKRYGKKLCLIGNIDLSYTLTRGSTEEVEAEVKQKLKDIAPGGGYCLGSSNSITSYVKIENYRAMLNAALKYGKYPIRIQ